MVEFTPTSFSTGKHLLTEQTAEGRKKQLLVFVKLVKESHSTQASNSNLYCSSHLIHFLLSLPATSNMCFFQLSAAEGLHSWAPHQGCSPSPHKMFPAGSPGRTGAAP